MSHFKAALILLASLAIVGCTPSRGPGDYKPASTGNGQGAISAIDPEALDAGNDTLDEGDTRSTNEKVADWFSNNSIPEEAKLCTIYFGFDKFSVDADARAKLEAIVDKTRGDAIYIVGYSDYYGTEEYNIGLSDKRAQAVKKYLNQIGGANSANVQAFGEQFAVQNGSKSEVKEDRKVIVVDGNAAN